MNLDVRIERSSKCLLKVDKKTQKVLEHYSVVSYDFEQTFTYCSKALKLFP